MPEPMNEALLTAEELAMPMGTGFLVAAKRLGLIYLADVVALAHVVARFTEEAIKVSHDLGIGLYSSDQANKAVDELIDRLSAILSGRNPRFMATSWFTDPMQLAYEIYMTHAPAYQSAPCDPSDVTRLRVDPIREAAFLIITTAYGDDFGDVMSLEEFVIGNVRELLNIPPAVPLDMLQMSQSTTATLHFRLPQP